MTNKSSSRRASTPGLNRSPGRKEGLRRVDAAQESEWRAKMLVMLYEQKAESDFIYAFEKTGNMVSSGTRDEWNSAQLKEWDGFRKEYQRRVGAESRIIDLCFKSGDESGRSQLSGQRRLAASEIGIAVCAAHERGISSFAVAQMLRDAWLDAVVMRSPGTEWDPTDHHRFDHLEMAPIWNLLSQIHDRLGGAGQKRSSSTAIEKRIEKIEAARLIAGTWFGRPPAQGQEGDLELVLVVEEIHYAISKCEQSGVPQDVIESMLLRSWVRMLVFNQQKEEMFFQTLDRHWEEVHAEFQVLMAKYSGLHIH